LSVSRSPAVEIVVRAEQSGRTVSAVVREAMSLPWTRAKALCESGRVSVEGQPAADPGARVLEGMTITVDVNAPRRRAGALSRDEIVFADRDVVVVEKPAGVMSVPFEPGDKDTLVDRTRAALRRTSGGYDPQLGVVQRLDKDTTGLLVFARTVAAKKHLQQQFRAHTIERRYVALAHGLFTRGRTFESELLRDRGDGLRGSWGVFRRPLSKAPPADAQHAVTHVRSLERLRGATLVECRLETGRQHQIRIHLAEAGHMLVGEPVYVREHRGERLDAPRPMLHAASLGFVHPRTEEPLHFDSDPPADFLATLDALRA
jgi:23S rRNA pseudouridine1911/1915/1917 synthase